MAGKLKNYNKKNEPHWLLYGIKQYIVKTVLISCIVGVLVWQTVIKVQDYTHVQALYNQIDEQQNINEELYQNNQRLALELNTLQDEKLEILESQARYKLGMIREGEQYYHLIAD